MITKLQEISKAPVAIVGVKAKNVGRGFNVLEEISGIAIPNSVVITTEEIQQCKRDDNFRYIIAKKVKEILAEERIIVRSSSVFEDSKLFSGAGQYESFMNRSTIEEISDAILLVCNSEDSDSAKTYNSLYLKASTGSNCMAVLCQEMIQCDFSGVLYTSDPINVKNDVFLIELNKGLGDKIASGECMSQTYQLPHGIDMSSQFDYPIFYDYHSISKNLRELCMAAELLMEEMKCDLDIEWGISNNKLYIFQVRPMFFSVAKCQNSDLIDSYSSGRATINGKPISNGIAIGCCDMHGIRHKDNFKLINIRDIMSANAIIVNKGGLLAHSASISRELGVPAIVCDSFRETSDFFAINAYLGTVTPWAFLDKNARATFIWESFWHMCNFVNVEMLKTRGIMSVEIKTEVESVITAKQFVLPENYAFTKIEKQSLMTYDTVQRELIDSNIIIRKQRTDQYIRLQVKKYSLSNRHFRNDQSLFFYFVSEEALNNFINQFPLSKTGTQMRTITHFEYEGYTINLIDWNGRLKYYTLSADKPERIVQLCKQGDIFMADLICKGGRDIFRDSNTELDFRL